jgi:hypothetical protein
MTEPTEDDMKWMTARAKELSDVRLKSLGHGARLCDEEIDRICAQAADEGERRAEEMRIRKRIEEDREARETGKPTLRVTFADLLSRRTAKP